MLRVPHLRGFFSEITDRRTSGEPEYLKTEKTKVRGTAKLDSGDEVTNDCQRLASQRKFRRKHSFLTKPGRVICIAADVDYHTNLSCESTGLRLKQVRIETQTARVTVSIFMQIQRC